MADSSPAAAPNAAEANAAFYQGLDSLAAGNLYEAITSLRRALELNPHHHDAAHGLIRALDQSGRSEEALAATHALILASPDDVLARTSLSMIYQRMGMIPEAEKAALDAKLLDWKHQLRATPEAPASVPDPFANDDHA
jgi:Flp pilus assembly protein TadD